MAAALFSGGAVGVGLDITVKTTMGLVDKARDFNTTLERYRKTCDRFEVYVKDIKQTKRSNNELGHPNEEVERLENLVRDLRELVNKYSGSGARGWRYMLRPYYHDMLLRSGQNLMRYLSEDVQLQMARDIREILDVNGTLSLRGLTAPPKKPEFTVGFDEPFKKLKLELLKDGGPPILMLTGLEGSGKTTLAKVLCWDDQIQGKFARNILFVTVSKPPNLKTIVQTLFEHYGCDRKLDFQTDEDAINRLENLLREVSIRDVKSNGGKGNPILLVLDDVRNGSEDLVEKFQFEISNYKILVTTRVAFLKYGDSCHLKPLDHDHAVSLFRHFIKPKSPNSYMPGEHLVQEIVKSCKGSRFALKVIGGLLCGEPSEVWQDMKRGLMKSQSILKSSNDLLSRLQNCLDILEDQEKDCFKDLGLFPEGKRICVPALIDMWAELYELDEDGQKAMSIINNLTNKNLANVIDTRKIVTDSPDMYYNNHFLAYQGLLRELTIHLSSHEPFGKRKRLIIDLSQKNRPEWWVGQNQQGIISRLLSSFFPLRWMDWVGQNQQGIISRSLSSFFPLRYQNPIRVDASTLSISTDETFTSDWCNMQANEAEVLVLNIQSKKYTLPEFIVKMSKLKVLIVTNYGFHRSELESCELLSCLANLIIIRLEEVSIPQLCKLESLQKLSIYMCDTINAFGSSSMKISDALPNLVELNIDYCKDMEELPSEICKITTLKKLSITTCHKLSALPQDIENLENLEVLRLSSCSNLVELPDSVVRLHKLIFLDISNCLELKQLPRDFGDLLSLEKLYMWGCSSVKELPPSVMNFKQLKHVMYVFYDDEETALWDNFFVLPNLKKGKCKPSPNLNWLPGSDS